MAKRGGENSAEPGSHKPRNPEPTSPSPSDPARQTRFLEVSDYEPVEAKAMASLAAVEVRWGETSGPNAWHTSEREHEHFDRLSGGIPDSRSRDDLIDPAVVRAIETPFLAAPLQQTHRILNKTIAHAADETSRGAAPIPGTTLQRHMGMPGSDRCDRTQYSHDLRKRFRHRRRAAPPVQTSLKTSTCPSRRVQILMKFDANGRPKITRREDWLATFGSKLAGGYIGGATQRE